MNWKFVALLYFIVSVLLGILAYAVLRDLVGQLFAFIGGACMGMLFQLAFLKNFGKPVDWK